MIDVVVIILRGLAIRTVSGATLGFVRTKLGATFHLFIFYLQTPMYDTDENKKSGNPSSPNAIANEPLAAPLYGENPTSLYAHVHIVNNPFTISSSLSESLGDNPSVFDSMGKDRLNSIFSTYGNASSTSITFFNICINENVPYTSTNRNSPNSNKNPPLSPP